MSGAPAPPSRGGAIAIAIVLTSLLAFGTYKLVGVLGPDKEKFLSVRSLRFETDM